MKNLPALKNSRQTGGGQVQNSQSDDQNSSNSQVPFRDSFIKSELTGLRASYDSSLVIVEEPSEYDQDQWQIRQKQKVNEKGSTYNVGLGVLGKSDNEKEIYQKFKIDEQAKKRRGLGEKVLYGESIDTTTKGPPNLLTINLNPATKQKLAAMNQQKAPFLNSSTLSPTNLDQKINKDLYMNSPKNKITMNENAQSRNQSILNTSLSSECSPRNGQSLNKMSLNQSFQVNKSSQNKHDLFGDQQGRLRTQRHQQQFMDEQRRKLFHDGYTFVEDVQGELKLIQLDKNKLGKTLMGGKTDLFSPRNSPGLVDVQANSSDFASPKESSQRRKMQSKDPKTSPETAKIKQLKELEPSQADALIMKKMNQLQIRQTMDKFF